MKIAVAAALVTVAVVRGAASPPIPERLSDTGLYLRGTLTIDPRNRPFAPQYALWTDGAAKKRWIQLPRGARIDGHAVDRWQFPVGTRFWKEFAFGGRRVETRLLWRSSDDQWAYASYVWNDEQTDASLAPATGMRSTAQPAPGKLHAIPSIEDCRTCHETGGSPVLGFTALQLSDDRDPLALHADPVEPAMLTLRSLVHERLLEPADSRLVTTPPRIPGDAPTRAALGYLTANCGHCHNEQGLVATVRHPLLMPAYPSDAMVRAALDQLRTRSTKWDIPQTVPGTSVLLAPGSPERSALLVRMRSRRPSSQMPPLGTVVPDREALELMSSWIQQLPGPAPCSPSAPQCGTHHLSR